MRRAAGTLGPAPTAAAKGAGDGIEAGGIGAGYSRGAAVEGLAAGGVGPWRTCGLKEWAPLVFAIFGPEGKQLERR